MLNSGISRRFFRIAIVAPLIAGAVLAGCGSGSSLASPSRYLLVLGDSLSTGYQPLGGGDRSCTHPKIDSSGHGGWACLLLAKLRASDSSYQIANLAVNGEDTCGYLTGKTCSGKAIGGADSQQRQARNFLQAHRGNIGLITIDIGADDAAALEAQASQGNNTQVMSELPAVFNRAMQNYRRILKRLRVLAPGVTIMALGYYVPNLPSYIPANLRPLAESVIQSLAQQFNAGVVSAAKISSAAYVDLYDPFLGKRKNLLVAGDIHPNDAGQRLVGRVVWRAYKGR